MAFLKMVLFCSDEICMFCMFCVLKCVREIQWKDLVCKRKVGSEQVSGEGEGRWMKIPRGSVRKCLRCESWMQVIRAVLYLVR